MRVGLSLLILSACSSASSGPPAEGELSVQWVGTDTGGFRARATARWCARDTLLEVSAVRNDTAFGVVLLPADTVSAGGYSVLSSELFIPIRPQANLALRYHDLGELKGFAGASGRVTVTAGGGVSGSFEGLLRREGTPDTARVQGSFAGVTIEPAIALCGRANRPSGG